MSIRGTAHFVSRSHAAHYYLPYVGGKWSEADLLVSEKLDAGEIFIGPPLWAGSNVKIITIDDGDRYAIQED